MKSSKRYLLVAIALLLATLLCSSLALAEAPASPITFNDYSRDFYYTMVGRGFWIQPSSALPEGAVGYYWESSTPAVVTVPANNNKTGSLDVFVTIKSYGDAVIKATAVDKDGKALEGQTGECKFTLKLLKAKDITMTTGYITNEVKEGETWDIPNHGDVAITINPLEEGQIGTSYNKYTDLIWSVSDTSIARISKDGKLTGLKASDTPVTVTATLKYDDTVKGTLAVKVVVEKEEKATDETPAFNQAKYYIEKGKELNLNNFLVYKGAVTYTSGDPSVVKIQEDGHTIVGLKAGKDVKITAIMADSGLKAECTVDVVEKIVPATSITATNSTFTLAKDQDMLLNGYVKILPEDVTPMEGLITWSSDKPDVASVEWGYVKANKAGTATITASVKGVETPATFTITVEDIPVETVFVNPSDVIYVQNGNFSGTSKRIGYIVSPENATNKTVLWSTSDATVATVNTSGLVKPLKAGTVTITATAASDATKTASCQLLIVDNKYPVSDVKFSTGSFTIATGLGKALDSFIKVLPENASDPTLIWSSSDVSVATVENGYIRTFKAGTVEITATAKSDATKVAKCTIKVEDKPVEKISFNQPQVVILKGDSDFQAVFFEPADASNTGITWTSSDPTIATVDQFGRVLALKAGTVTITATSASDATKTAAYSVTVTETVPPTSIKFALKSFKFVEGYTFDNLGGYITIDPIENLEDGYIVLLSSDPQAVEVLDEGFGIIANKVTATPVTITAYWSKNPEIKDTCEVTVVKDPLTAIAVAQNAFTMNAGEYLELYDYIQVKPADFFKGQLDIKSSDIQIVDVYGTTLEAKKIGTATITISSSEYPTVTPATVTVTVKKAPATAVTFTQSAFTVKQGRGIEIWKCMRIAPYDYYTSEEDDIAWDSTDWEIANWDDDGCIVGRELGTATITATVFNEDGTSVSGSFTITVVKDELKGLAFGKNAYTRKLTSSDRSIDLSSKLLTTPSNYRLDRDDLIWESSDPNVATVSSSGFVYAYKPGKTTITVKSADDETIKATTTVTFESIPVSKVKMPKKTMRLFFYELNEDNVYTNTYSIYPIIEPANAFVKDITWETTNAAVAFVLDPGGNGSGIDLKSGSSSGTCLKTSGAGNCIITAFVDDGVAVHEVSMEVIVSTKIVKVELNASKKTINMVKGAENTFALQAFDSETDTPVDVKWSSSNKKVATVDKDGVVKALKAGKVTITATTKDGNKSTAVCNITVKQLKIKKLTAVKKSVKLKAGEELQLEFTIKPVDAYNQALKFKSSKTSVVTVDSTGVITAVAPGKAVITATTKDGSKKTVKINVTVE